LKVAPVGHSAQGDAVWREWRFLLLSAGLHALVIVAALVFIAFEWLITPKLLVAVSSRHNEMQIDIDQAVLNLPQIAPPEPLVPPPPSDDANPNDARQATATDPRNSARNDHPTEPGPPGPEATSVPNAPNGPRSDEYDPLPQTGVLTAPGVGGPPVWTMPGMMPDPGRPAPASTTTPRAREVDKDIAGKVIRQAMREGDKSKGIEIPAAGTAASAVQASLYGSDLPAEARGTIAIQIGPGGAVTGVKVVSMAGGNADQWEKAAQAAAARLRQAKLDLPEEFKNGAIIYLDAVSTEQSPAGKGSGISGNTAKFDLSNIGAHKRQVVRVATRVVAVR
jgi:hypothetical protein